MRTLNAEETIKLAIIAPSTVSGSGSTIAETTPTNNQNAATNEPIPRAIQRIRLVA
jgi:4-diphosphocytidyl-2C-methyl-D-erythritol kinase